MTAFNVYDIDGRELVGNLSEVEAFKIAFRKANDRSERLVISPVGSTFELGEEIRPGLNTEQRSTIEGWLNDALHANDQKAATICRLALSGHYEEMTRCVVRIRYGEQL